MDSLKLDLTSAPEETVRVMSPVPGDVYAKRGGPPGFWVIVAVRPCGDAHVLAFDLQGNITGSQTYRASYFAEHWDRRCGHVEITMGPVEWVNGWRP